MQFPFLEQGKTGRNNSTTTLGAMAFTWGSFLILGGFPLLVLVSYFMMTDPAFAEKYTQNPGNPSLLPLSEIAFFVVIMFQFPIGMAGVWAGTRFMLKRKFKSLLTSAARFRWKRMFVGFGLWAGLMGAYAVILYLKHPGYVKYEPDWDAFWPFLPVALLLVPIQSAFEEIAVRGQLMQIAHARTRFRPIASLLFTSVFFAMLHSMNPEVESYGWFTMMAQYMAIGLILGLFAILDGGLELSIGMHTANNLFSFLLLSYPGSVLETPSIFHQGHIEPWQDLLAILGIGFVLFVILYGKRPEILKGLVAKREEFIEKS